MYLQDSNSFMHFRKSLKNRDLTIELSTPMGLSHKIEEIRPHLQKWTEPENLIFVISDQRAIHPYRSYSGRTFVQMQSSARVLKYAVTKNIYQSCSISLKIFFLNSTFNLHFIHALSLIYAIHI